MDPLLSSSLLRAPGNRASPCSHLPPATIPFLRSAWQMLSTGPSVHGPVLRSLPCHRGGWSLPGTSGRGTTGSVLLELSLPGLTHEHQWAWLRAEETFCGCPLVDATLTLPSFLVAFLQLAAPGHLRLCGPRVAVQPPQMPSRPEETAWRELCGTLSSPSDPSRGRPHGGCVPSPSDPSHGHPHGGRVPSPSRFPGPRPSRLEEARPFIHSRGVHLLWTSHGHFSGEVTEGSGLAEVLRR